MATAPPASKVWSSNQSNSSGQPSKVMEAFGLKNSCLRTLAENSWKSSMAMTQEPIDWRYRFHIFLAYFLGLCKEIYPQHIANHMVQYLHFRILKFPLIKRQKIRLGVSKQRDLLICRCWCIQQDDHSLLVDIVWLILYGLRMVYVSLRLWCLASSHLHIISSSSQEAPGLWKFWISLCRSTQNQRVGVWQGP